jgi:glycosyltransferase involved in cell wall biosynthesis
MRRRIYRTFDGFAVPNKASAEWALAQAGELRPTVSLPNAIDAEFFARPTGISKSTSRQKIGLENASRVFVQVSALNDRKGVLELASGFLGIPMEDRRGAALLFVGEGPRRPELEALASKSGGSIRLLGQLPPEEVRQVLWAADAFVLNTKLDPNPLSAIEAAAAGLPIVMSAAAGNVREVVEDRETGFVIRDPAAPAWALRSVLAATDAQLNQMGVRAAQLAIADFDVSSVARKLMEQLY